MEYNDENIPMHCSECDKLEEGIPDMVAHILTIHPSYTPQEAAQFARIWADNAYEDIDVKNVYDAENRRTYIDNDE